MGRHAKDPDESLGERITGPMRRVRARNDLPANPHEGPSRRAWPVALILTGLIAVLVVAAVLTFAGASSVPDPMSATAGSMTASGTVQAPRPAVVSHPTPVVTVYRRPVANAPRTVLETVTTTAHGPTVYRTLPPPPAAQVTVQARAKTVPGPAVTKTVRTTVTARPEPAPTVTVTETEQACFRVRQGVIVARISCP